MGILYKCSSEPVHLCDNLNVGAWFGRSLVVLPKATDEQKTSDRLEFINTNKAMCDHNDATQNTTQEVRYTMV